MSTGVVRWFNATKGYGFIKPSDGTIDVFVTLAAVQAAGLAVLREGQGVTYEVIVERGKAHGVETHARVAGIARK